MVEHGYRPKDAAARNRGRDQFQTIVEEFLKGHLTISRDAEVMINKRIAEIDELISNQLNEILHHPDFQKLEGSWRGLFHLVTQTKTGPMMKIRVMNSSKNELFRDFERATEFDQNALWKKVYEAEYGLFGGTPYGALIGDYEFCRDPDDIELLKHISNVAAAAHAPFFSAAHPSLINQDSWEQINNPRDLAMVYESTEFASWKSFRNSEDSRYVGLCLPRTLGRRPYGSTGQKVEGGEFNYEEKVDGKDHAKYLWMNAAYSLGVCATRSFTDYGMAVAMRGVVGGGLVKGLPVHNFPTGEGEIVMKCPTEVSIPDRRDAELQDLGFIPLIHCKDTDYAAFFSVRSCQKPKLWDTDEANANSRLSIQMPYIMATSRFAHYLKSMMRDRIGGFMSRSEAEAFLNRWIIQYVTPDDNAGQEAKASKPLREARIDVFEMPGKPGVYRAVALLRPHFQLEELTVSLRLVAELPAAPVAR
jgi:type VI secretion system protein ImpC